VPHWKLPGPGWLHVAREAVQRAPNGGTSRSARGRRRRQKVHNLHLCIMNGAYDSSERESPAVTINLPHHMAEWVADKKHLKRHIPNQG
jgi:hypothetical protein